jgi:putative FmdB family regulatory protein
MPIYEYVCDDCGAHYERIVMNGSTVVTCPQCTSARSTLQLSVFAAHGSTAKSSSAAAASSNSGGCCGGACGCRN